MSGENAGFLPLDEEAQKASAAAREEVITKATAFVETYNLLFGEAFKAYMLVLQELHRHSVCTWNDLFEKSGLKRMGVSGSTVSRVIKVLEGVGIVQKEKAPFPFKSRYRLVKRHPVIDAYIKDIDRVLLIEDQAPEQYMKLVQAWIRTAEHSPALIASWFALGSPLEAARAGFMLLDYLFHLALYMPPQVLSDLQARLDEAVKETLAKGRQPETALLEKILVK